MTNRMICDSVTLPWRRLVNHFET